MPIGIELVERRATWRAKVMAIALAESVITAEQRESFFTNGFLRLPNLLTLDEVETLRRRADDMVTGRVPMPQGDSIGGRSTGIAWRKAPGPTPPPTDPPEEKVTATHARRGTRVYPFRQGAIDEAALAAELERADPWHRVARINHLTDHDEVFRAFASHPKIAAVLSEILFPHVKVFFDQMFVKGPYDGPNRFHQDGFFNLSERSVTCWIPLEEATPANGCLQYIPETIPYGYFPEFDEIAHGVTVEMLEAAVLLPMKPGDVAFHDRWTLHATGPNETAKGRRAWAMHCVSAKARMVTADVEKLPYTDFEVTPDGEHWSSNKRTGNREIYGCRQWTQVVGRSFPGCV